jgi:DNA-binding NarL/FixJ family response regulator
MPPLIKVLLVEDDWAVRNAVRDYLVRHGLTVCEADSQQTALATAEAEQPDVVVLDIVLPEKSGDRPVFEEDVGINVARRLREMLPRLGVVFLSAYVDRGPEVVQLFVDGHDRIVYLLKGSRPEELWNAIHKVARGLSGLEIAPGVRATRQTAFDLALSTLAAEERKIVEAALCALRALSLPERRVFEAVGSCQTHREAAMRLNIAAKTVSSHMDAIYDKLRLRDTGNGLNPLALLAKIHLLAHLQELERS